MSGESPKKIGGGYRRNLDVGPFQRPTPRAASPGRPAASARNRAGNERHQDDARKNSPAGPNKLPHRFRVLGCGAPSGSGWLAIGFTQGTAGALHVRQRSGVPVKILALGRNEIEMQCRVRVCDYLLTDHGSEHGQRTDALG
jgi:hypothetical protein